jgi:ribosomal protein L35AE/L33A
MMDSFEPIFHQSARGKFAHPASWILLAAYVLGVVVKSYQWYRLRNWTEARAAIVEINKPMTIRESGAKYEFMQDCVVRYTYDFAGQSYQGTRVRIQGLTKHVAGRFRFHKKLWDAHNSGVLVPVFVNPANPSEAILDRRWPWLSLLITGIVVAGAFYATKYSLIG